MLFAVAERRYLRDLPGLLLKNLRSGLSANGYSITMPRLDEKNRCLCRTQPRLQSQSQRIAMQNQQVMLIPGNSLFFGQRDERTLLGHDGHSFLSMIMNAKKNRRQSEKPGVCSLLAFICNKTGRPVGDLSFYGGHIIYHENALSRVNLSVWDNKKSTISFTFFSAS